MRRTPPLNSLRVFEAVARHGSLTRAASELLVTQGAVSRQIKVLEDSLGFAVFERQGRSIRLTSSGQLYYRDVRNGLSQLRIATDRVVAAQSNQTIRVMAYATFATRWLIPRMNVFKTTYPTIDVQLTTSLNRVDFDSRNFDLAIRSGPRAWPQLTYTKLSLPSILTPVCSPALLGESPLSEPADLARHTLLHSNAMPDSWHEWLVAAGTEEVPLHGGLRFESSTMAYEAALCGAGIALARLAFIKAELGSGRLIAPFHHLTIPHEHDYLIIAEQKRHNPARDAFSHWILHESERG